MISYEIYEIPELLILPIPDIFQIYLQGYIISSCVIESLELNSLVPDAIKYVELVQGVLLTYLYWKHLDDLGTNDYFLAGFSLAKQIFNYADFTVYAVQETLEFLQ